MDTLNRIYDMVGRILPVRNFGLARQIPAICPTHDLRIMPVDLEILQLGYRLSKAWVANGGRGKRKFINLENGWHLEEQLQYPLIPRLVIRG